MTTIKLLPESQMVVLALAVEKRVAFQPVKIDESQLQNAKKNKQRGSTVRHRERERSTVKIIIIKRRGRMQKEKKDVIDRKE